MSILTTFEGVAGGIASPITGPVGGLVSGVAGSAAGFVLQGISSWVLNGTKSALQEVASAIGTATAPNLNSTWFSSTYWRVAALAAMLTIPFLCAAAVQAVARADLSLLARVTFGYLPLSLLGVSLAAPLTMLLLAATDQMSAAVSTGAAGGGAHFLDHAAVVAGALGTAAGGSPFFAVVVGLLALMAAMALAIELLVRAAAVYVVVLMLPLAFAALVWPARRVWAVRLVELLSSLILSKFVIVAVLSLAAAAFAHGTPGIGELLVAMSLILLSTFAPWALMRILPFTELASGAAEILRNELPHSQARAAASEFTADAGGLAMELPARLRAQARSMHGRGAGDESAATEPVATPAEATVAMADVMSPLAHARGAAGSEPVAQAAQPTPGEHSESATASSPARGVTAQREPEDTREPFVLPQPWLAREPMRLNRQLADAGKARTAPDAPTPERRPSPEVSE
jgi:hypothetical protein